MKIAIVSPVVVPGDAVSNDVIGMYSVLRAAGYDADIFAEAWTVSDTPIKKLETLEDTLTKPEDILLYHFSVGWEPGLALLRNLRCRKAIKYHNITPPEYFDGVNADYAHICRAGRQMLDEVAQTPIDLFLSDSAYNEAELISRGADGGKSFVIPPFHHIDELLETDCDIETLDKFRDEYVNILMVGRLAPNKGHVALAEAFAKYYYEWNAKSRLIIVGKHDPRLSSYVDAIDKVVARNGLEEHVTFTGEVTNPQLKAYFLTARVFAIASEHEGFCVPLVEAMAHYVPVTSYASTAITETIGRGGIAWPERDPLLLAASWNELARRPDLAESLGELGAKRYREVFDNAVIRQRFLGVMQQLAGPASTP